MTNHAQIRRARFANQPITKVSVSLSDPTVPAAYVLRTLRCVAGLLHPSEQSGQHFPS
jgi:hypothetical protein